MRCPWNFLEKGLLHAGPISKDIIGLDAEIPILDKVVIELEDVLLTEEHILDKEMKKALSLDLIDDLLVHKEIADEETKLTIEMGVEYDLYKYLLHTQGIRIEDHLLVNKEMYHADLLAVHEDALVSKDYATSRAFRWTINWLSTKAL